MEYVKHNWEYFKKVELKDLDKKELIKLITDAIEIQPRIIERWNTYPRWSNWFYVSYKSSLSDTTLISAWGATTCTKLASWWTLTDCITSLPKSDLINLCKTL